MINCGQNTSVKFAENIEIREHVELIIKDGASLTLSRNVLIDRGVRIIVASGCNLIVGEGSKIMMNCMINCGADIDIGSNCGIGAFSVLNSSPRNFDGKSDFRELGWNRDPISIGSNAYIDTHCVIFAGSVLEDNVRLLPHSVVRGTLLSGKTYYGAPATSMENEDG